MPQYQRRSSRNEKVNRIWAVFGRNYEGLGACDKAVKWTCMPSCLQFPKVTIPQQYIPFSNPTIYQENLDYATEMLEIKYVGNTMMAYGLARISCLLLLFIGVCIMIFVPNLEDYPDLFLTCMISTRILLTMFLLLSANIAYTHNVNIKAALLQLEETAESWSHSGVEYCIVRKSFCGYITGAEMVITWGR